MIASRVSDLEASVLNFRSVKGKVVPLGRGDRTADGLGNVTQRTTELNEGDSWDVIS